MSNTTSPTIYAMVGPMGSGKTTFALKLAKEKGAAFFSLDRTIKEFNQPIRDLKDYEAHMAKALDLIGSGAIRALKSSQSVSMDFGGGIGHWNWLKNIADSTNAVVEIYVFDIPLATRLKRVQARNEEKPEGVYHFTMSEKEVLASKPQRETPPASDRVKIITITDNSAL